jgi:hypothetical protein
VLHLKHQKHNDESEHRRSRLSSASFSSQDDISKLISPSEAMDESSVIKAQDSQIKNYINMDFKRNKEAVSFQKTITLVTGLIGELEMKQRKIKARKKVAAV